MAAFPSTPLLPGATGVDENPWSAGGLWLGPLRTGKDQLRRVSNQLAETTAGFGTGESYYTPAIYGESEIYATVLALPGTDGDFCELVARVLAPNTAGVDFYALEWVFHTAGLDSLDCYRVINGAFTSLGTFATLDVAVGDQLGFRVTGNSGPVNLECWRAPVATGAFAQVGATIVDSNAARILSPGNVGLVINELSSTTRLGSPGGGEVATAPAAAAIPRIIRSRRTSW